jgi:hypothetical protein
MFLPGPFSRFYEVAKRPERNIHFAGEHLSRHHTWISGALDSALTSVRQVTGEDVPALGREHISKQLKGQTLQETMHKAEVLKSKVEKFSISSVTSGFTIPLHLNVQCVEVR